MSTLLDRQSSATRLLDRYSLEITAKEARALIEAKELISPGTQISVTFLASEDYAARIEAASAVKALGFQPMPHIAARRLRSEEEFTQFLKRLQSETEADRCFVIAGDPPDPLGPYADALAVIRTGLLAKHGIRKVGIAGYPDGHPAISNERLQQALTQKLDILAELGHEAEIVTQFSFDPDPVLAWLQKLRATGITAPVRIGVPGPTSVSSLLRMATRTGVSATAGIVAKYGISITKLLGVAGPTVFVEALASQLRGDLHGDVQLHFYTFGSIQRAAGWIREYQTQAAA